MENGKVIEQDRKIIRENSYPQKQQNIFKSLLY